MRRATGRQGGFRERSAASGSLRRSTRIEYTGRERTFTLRKPFGYRLQAGGEIPGFAQPQRESYGGKARNRGDAGMRDMRDGPEDHAGCVAGTRSEIVD